MISLANVILFYACWFISVLGAANGHALVGPIAVLAMVMIHLLLHKREWREQIAIIIITTILGTGADSLNPLLGFVTFNTAPILPWDYPLWMVTLWACFATTLTTSLRWINERYFTAFVFGFLGGPLSYWAGVEFGAITFTTEKWLPLLINAIEWGFVLPLLLLILKRIQSSIRG